MKPTNIISAIQGTKAFQEYSNTEKPLDSPYSISKNDFPSLHSFCDLLKTSAESFDIFDGYLIGFRISQIGKEFDLLRFSDDLVVNIELKQYLNLPDEQKINKILEQQQKNYYYLKALQKDTFICTYIQNDGLYEYEPESSRTHKIEFEKLVNILEKQEFKLDIDPDTLFIPKNYLISPFNTTERFLNNEYFLTDNQNEIKKKILKNISSQYMIFCITADAGTGKTLLLYDIAKTILQDHKILVIHCGKLNQGHELLKDQYHWNIHSIRNIRQDTLANYFNQEIRAVFIDESQRIREPQIKMIIQKSKELNIPLLFSYDTKQYLSTGESRDVFEYIKDKYPEINVSKKKLTNKIRTNHNISSFITNLLKIGKSNSHLNYQNISIEYFEDKTDLKRYLHYLQNTQEWKLITYTGSQYTSESIDLLASLSDVNAHDVIGQEFNKVVFVMDNNFQYAENGTLQYNKNTYYSLSGMFYQIITRVVNEMKIIVYQNKPLYYRLLEIKSFDKNNN